MHLIGDISPQKAEAIHRSLLSGLLNHVAAKGQNHEYAAVRGAKVSIFPGSVLFRKQPRWITAAEIVQTTRQYARTVAPVDPRAIERAGAHLVRRTYSEPTWDSRRAHVSANEKVMLGGLVVVPARQVDYGRIDPRAARELFILHALVRSEYQSRAPFFRHNADLVDRALELQARLRRHDLLADEQQRYRFFDQRVPAHVCNGPLFETWRKSREAEEPRALFLGEADVFAKNATRPTEEQAPGHIEMNGVRFALRYVYDPASDADGVTLIIPLEHIDAIDAKRLEWLTPALLEQKVLALLRSLPRDLRKLLIPAAEVAQQAVAAMPFGDGSLYAVLAAILSRRLGTVITPDAFDLSALEPWQRFHLVLVDAEGHALLSGRDLQNLRQEGGLELARLWKESSPQHGPFHRDELTRWDFGPLPVRVAVHLRGMTTWGYPALVDQGQTASLRLFATQAEAADAMRGGIRRLFLSEVGSQALQLLRALPQYSQMSLIFSTIANPDELRLDLLLAVADQALFPGPAELPRDRESFAALAARAWDAMPSVARDVSRIVGDVLDRFQLLKGLLDGSGSSAFAVAYADMRRQLSELVYSGFVSRTPREMLVHLPRYLRAIESRLRKLNNAGSARDSASQAQLQPLLAEWQARQRQRVSAADRLLLDTVRWQLEELRVSLFAQEIGTAKPVSIGRIRELLDQIKTPLAP